MGVIVRQAIKTLLGKKGVTFMSFRPYTNHVLGGHGYKEFDGEFPCKDRADAIAIFLDLKAKGELKPHTAGIIVSGGNPVFEKITVREIDAETKKQSGK